MNLIAESYTPADTSAGPRDRLNEQARSSRSSSCRLPSLNLVQALLVHHNIINPHHEEGEKPSVGFIGTAALSEKIQTDAALYSDLELQYDAARAGSSKKIPARFRAKKNASPEEILALKKDAVIDWAADACLDLIKATQKASKAKTLSRTNNFSRITLPEAPNANVIPTNFYPKPPVHEELRVKVKELRARCLVVKNFTFEWDYTRPTESFIKFTEVCDSIFKLALTINTICGPKDKIRVSTEVPTYTQVAYAQKCVAQAVKTIDKARGALDETLTAPERIRLQSVVVNEWVDQFFAKHEAPGRVKTCLERWKITKADVTQALKHCGDKEYPIHVLRDEVARSIAELGASRARAHLVKRNADGLIPAEITAKGSDAIFDYLNAEHGWRFRAAHKAWLAMAVDHPEILTFDLSKRYIFLHRYIVSASKIDPLTLIQTALVTHSTTCQRIETPYTQCLIDAWRQTFGGDITGKNEKRFYGQLSDLLGHRMREEVDDAHVTYYIRESQTDAERAAKTLDFIFKEFRYVAAEVAESSYRLINDSKMESLEAARRATIRETAQMTNLMRSLFDIESERTTARLQTTKSERRDTNSFDNDGGFPPDDAMGEESPRPRWTIATGVRVMWANMTSWARSSLGALLASRPVLRLDSWLTGLVTTSFPRF